MPDPAPLFARLRRRAAAMLMAVLLGSVTACLTPPALFSAGQVDLGYCVRNSPSGAQLVELTSSGRVLRGVFVPAGADAPVVLHLVGSGQSVGSLAAAPHFLFERLRSLGLASLALDYGGVGVSDGERDVRHLREDALAMWREALRRTGGDPRRVVLRCTSIGGIAAGELLDAGATPRAVIWIAPVSPQTALHQAVARTAGALPAALVSWAFAPISRVDPIAALGSTSTAVLLVGSAQDSFIDAKYLERLREFARAGGCEFIENPGSEHEWLAVSSLEPSAHEALCLLRWSATLGAPVEPTEGAAREAWLADAALRDRFRTLAWLAPALSPEELVAAAQLDDLERSAAFVWLRGRRGSPHASFAEFTSSYRELARCTANQLSLLRAFNLICGRGGMVDLHAAVRAVCAWNGQLPLITTWHRGDTLITHTLGNIKTLEAQFELPLGVNLRRAWMLEAFARGMGLLVTRRPRPDGTAGVYYLDDAGRWVALGCDDTDAHAP